MKKITSIATALCMATAFCGFCAGCASDIKAQDPANAGAATPTVSAAGSNPKVILSPGYQQGYGSTANTIATGATKLTATEEETYWVTNAYFADVAAGADLPTPTTTRAKTTFDGWTYAKDGVVTKVEKMPSSLSDDLYLYARWKTEGSGNVGGGGGGQEETTTGATVNGKPMTKNLTPGYGATEEYMLEGVSLSTGDTLTFKLNGSNVTVDKLENSSTGLSYSNGTITVSNGGTFNLYLKKVDDAWVVYGSRAIDAGEVKVHGEEATAGNVYLAGNVSDADFDWTNWSDKSIGEHKGLKATKNGSTYTLTVTLKAGANCKFVKYGASLVWQNTLSGGGSNITLGSGPMDNMEVKVTGTYTFTITENGSNLSVSVTKA